MNELIFSQPWSISADRFRTLQGYQAGMDILPNRPKGLETKGKTAIISITGVISKRGGIISKLFGGTALDEVMVDFQKALTGPDVENILLFIDSPGGTVDGTQELADLIYNSRGKKRIFTFSDGIIASAAYWIGAAAEEVYISGPTVEGGSIGVVAAHVDISKYEEKIGFKTTEIYAGKYKRIASNYGPLTDEGKGEIQAQVDYLYSIFVNDVAKYRPQLSVDHLGAWADGKVFIGSQAIQAGLVDGMGSLDVFLESIAAGRPAKAEGPSFDDKLLLKWKHNSALRAEFANDYETYKAFYEAKEAGLVGRL